MIKKFQLIETYKPYSLEIATYMNSIDIELCKGISKLVLGTVIVIKLRILTNFQILRFAN